MRVPDSAVIAADDLVRVVGVYPDVVKIAVRAATDSTEAFTAIDTEDQAATGFVDLVVVLRIDNEIGEVEGTPDHHLAAIAFLPGFATIGRTEQGAAVGFDKGVNGVRIRRRNSNCYTSPGLCRQAFGGVGGEFGPVCAAVGGLEKCTSAFGLRVISARTECPAFAAKIPGARVESFMIRGTHRDRCASGRGIGAFENQIPVLAAVFRFIKAAIFAVAPQLSGYAGIDGVAVFRVNDDLADSLGVFQAGIDPVFSAVGRLIDTISDGDTVACPAFSGTHPYNFRITGVDRDSSDGLNGLLVEDWLEGCASVHGFPNTAASGADEDSEPSLLPYSSDGGHAAADFTRANIARA